MTDMPEILKAKLNAPLGLPLEAARQFLRRYWGDEGILDAIRVDMEDTIAFNPKPVVQGLQAIEGLLADPPSDGTLLDLVLWDANHPLDDPSAESAKQWLGEMAEFVRDVLGDKQPPRQISPNCDT
jgi:hypothetical protein